MPAVVKEDHAGRKATRKGTKTVMSTDAASNGALPRPDRIKALLELLCDGLVERDDAVRLGLLAALTGEHLLLLGPPGTAKSLVARRLHRAFRESLYFERLLTRFTVPEELFGPLSIKALEEDRYERLIDSYLPASSLAFLDEVFKANSAILNALLTLLNEREFDNGTRRIKTPLIAVIGASNEIPEGEELAALYDRFLLRMHVEPVSRDAFPALLGLRGSSVVTVPDELKLSVEDLHLVQSAAQRIRVSDDVLSLLRELREWCLAEKIVVSDRRWRKIVNLLQVSALTCEREVVSIWDCWLLQHCLWNKPEDRIKVYKWYCDRVGASAAMDPSRLTKLVVSWESRLEENRESRSQRLSEDGKLLFKGQDGSPTTNSRQRRQAHRGSEPLFLAPENSRDPRGNSITDRTVGGKGLTISELNEYRVDGEYMRGPFCDSKQGKEYLKDPKNWLMEDAELPPMLEPTRFDEFYIDACIEQLERLDSEVKDYETSLHVHIANLEAQIHTHLWVPSSFKEPASSSLTNTNQHVKQLRSRLEEVRKGISWLPRRKHDGNSEFGRNKVRG